MDIAKLRTETEQHLRAFTAGHKQLSALGFTVEVDQKTLSIRVSRPAVAYGPEEIAMEALNKPGPE